MSARLASNVRDYLESPTPGEMVTLIVGVEPEASDAIEQISSTGAEVEEELPYDCLAVTVDQSDLESVCNLNVVETVEVEKDFRTRGDTDFRLR